MISTNCSIIYIRCLYFRSIYLLCLSFCLRSRSRSKIDCCDNYREIENYCDREVDNYNNLDAVGFGKFCAETIYIGDFSGEPAYIMEKCECDEEFVSSFSYKRIQMQIYRETLENGTEEEAVEAAANDARIQSILWDYDDDERTFEAMKNSWGTEEEDNIVELQNLCDECCINDLHAGNVGLLNGRMVLVDYSGYND